MSETGVINQKSLMKLFSVSVHPSKALHLSPIMTLRLRARVCVRASVCAQCVHSDCLSKLWEKQIVCCTHTHCHLLIIYETDNGEVAV